VIIGGPCLSRTESDLLYWQGRLHAALFRRDELRDAAKGEGLFARHMPGSATRKLRSAERECTEAARDLLRATRQEAEAQVRALEALK
jgi:hypothetical protein